VPQGKAVSRQCLIARGLLPVLAAPSPNGDALLEEAIAMAGAMGIVQPSDYVVCVQRVQRDFAVKVVSVDEMGVGIQRLDPHVSPPKPPSFESSLRPVSDLLAGDSCRCWALLARCRYSRNKFRISKGFSRPPAPLV
jgi:hypothetical protein